MIGKYRYLRKSELGESIEDDFELSEIVKLFTVRGESEYTVFANRDEFLKVLESIPAEKRIFHEVIFDQPQKLKFDIDAAFADVSKLGALRDGGDINAATAPTNNTPTNTADPTTTYNDVVSSIIESINTVFYVTFGKIPDIIRMDTSRPKPTSKFSTHLIIDNYYVDGADEAAEFTRAVAKFIPKMYLKFLDIGVNKRLQNFRIAKCHKGDGRFLELPDGVNITHTLITNVAGCDRLNIAVEKKTNTKYSSKYTNYDIENTIEIAAQFTKNHRFHSIRNGLFIYMRESSDYCELCKRVHDSDNTVLVSIGPKDSKNIAVFKQCRKYKLETGGSAIKIGEYPNPEFSGDVSGKAISRCLSAVKNGDANTHSHQPSPYQQQHLHTLFRDCDIVGKNIYKEPTLRPFELCDTLVVHAMMKMGKTKALRDYITRHFSDRIVRNKIVFTSFRQTFSGNIKEKFPDFTLYSDVKGDLKQARVIIQVESLYRLVVDNQPPDLLVLDECESIFEQFDSGLLRRFSECFAKFMYLIKYSKHVVLMDATISNRTYRLLREWRGLEGVVYHANTFQNATKDKYYLTQDKAKWLSALHSSLESGEKIAIQISSLNEAKIIEEGIKKKFPELHVRLYSSETSMATKREHFSNVGVYWSECDVLIYTPTVSAGVSYEIKRFDKCFCYFTDYSCPVETCVQMIGRIRDVGDKTYVVYMEATGARLPTDVEQIRAGIMHSRENLFKTFDQSGLQIEYNGDGEIEFKEGPYFKLWCENTAIRNLSKNGFIKRFIGVVRSGGATCIELTDDLFENMFGEIIDMETHKEIGHELANKAVNAIVDAPEIEDEEYERITEDMNLQKEISAADVACWRRYKLRRDYKYGGEITSKFVVTYNNRTVRRQYKNWNRIMCMEDPMEAISYIQKEELAMYKYNVTFDKERDVLRRYVFDQHRYAIGLLRLCGWSHITDVNYLNVVILADNFRKRWKRYWETIYNACTEFQITPPRKAVAIAGKESDSAIVQVMLEPVNKILNNMYGVAIAEKKSDPGMFKIARKNLFSIKPSKTKPIISGNIIQDKFSDE